MMNLSFQQMNEDHGKKAGTWDRLVVPKSRLISIFCTLQ